MREQPMETMFGRIVDVAPLTGRIDKFRIAAQIGDTLDMSGAACASGRVTHNCVIRARPARLTRDI
ncbi:hypothetical protein ACFQFQ_17585 [Sulfitobacter porphyrae]|uniref:Uncharacterized protein n=1 Tax=Sulfitobacter porphyrae TaxID=1246864 RepID=A0ABW2B566_9RHOB